LGRVGLHTTTNYAQAYTPTYELNCILLFHVMNLHCLRQAVEPIQPTVPWVQRALSVGVKRPRRKAPSSAEVKNAWGCTSTPLYVFIAWCLVKHKI
jgi:hypothetical protein